MSEADTESHERHVDETRQPTTLCSMKKSLSQAFGSAVDCTYATTEFLSTQRTTMTPHPDRHGPFVSFSYPRRFYT